MGTYRSNADQHCRSEGKVFTQAFQDICYIDVLQQPVKTHSTLNVQILRANYSSVYKPTVYHFLNKQTRRPDFACSSKLGDRCEESSGNVLRRTLENSTTNKILHLHLSVKV